MKNNFTRFRTLLILTLLGIGFLWVFRAAQTKAPDQQSAASSSTAPGESRQSTRGPKIQKSTDRPPESRINEFFPKWLREKGNLFQEPHEVNGLSIQRSRARYEWEDGKRLEIEISDLGASADPGIAQNLGFHLSMENEESDSGYTMTQTDEAYLLNEEYDHNDQAGSLQLFIENRYLLEIQIEGLPHEAFQEILNEDISFDQLFSDQEK